MGVIMCKHTELDECKCPCHEPTETGEPLVLHIIACCEYCPKCGRNISKYPSFEIE